MLKQLKSNKVISFLIIHLLIVINLFVLSKFSIIYSTLGQIFTSISLPLLLSLISYYLMRPIIKYLEKRGLDKLSSIIALFIIIICVIILMILTILPIIRNQFIEFIENYPDIKQSIIDKLIEIENSSLFGIIELHSISQHFSSQLENSIKSISNHSIEIINSFTSSAINIILAIVMSPFITFYFLKDDRKLLNSMITFFPEKYKQSLFLILKEIDIRLSQYIRSQIIISSVVGIIFYVLLKFINIKYASIFAIVGGLLNLIPYFGSMLFSIILIIYSATISQTMLIGSIICIMIEQTIEGRFITPVILGKQLEIHPITIMIILLSASSVFGIIGVFLAIPIYSILKVIVVSIFKNVKTVNLEN